MCDVAVALNVISFHIYTTQNRSENTTILPILLNITIGCVHFASFQTAAKHEFESHILTL